MRQALVCCILLLLLSATAAQARVFHFDDITNDGDSALLPADYAGMQWDNFGVLNATQYDRNPSGYLAGRVSSPNVGFNAYSDPAYMSSQDGSSFFFAGTYMTAAWNTGTSVTVRGYKDGSEVHSRNLTVDCYRPTWFDFNWNDVDKVGFFSSGGAYYGPYPGSGSHIAIDNLRIYDYAAPPAPAPVDPVAPPVHTSRYNFVVGAQPYFQWDGITVGLDLSLSVPTLEPFEYHPSFTYPEDPISPELDPWQTNFSTNSRFLGTILSAAAPLEFNAVELQGTARLSADAVAEAGIYLEDGASHADIGASIGAGLNLTLNMQASSDFLNILPGQIRDLLPLGFEFTYPIAGAGPFESPEVAIPLGATFDVDVFRQALADVDPTDAYYTIDDVVDTVTVLGIPINLRDTTGDDQPDEASVTIGASASAYAQTSATAGIDFFFYEVDDEGDVVQSTSIFETLSHLWNQSVELADKTVVQSETGTVEIHPDGLLELVTGSPVWMKTIMEVDDLTNLLAFEADFESAEGAEGLLQVYWDDHLVATVDERLAGDLPEEYLFALPDTYAAGAYSLSFRLDSFTDVDSEILIGNITTGYMATIPEPATMMLVGLGLGALALRRRKRSK